ncbi:two-component response regulator-like APRR2 isoform X2 [Mercurialis annua]|uniref:two-component response regulator-like APRR2 isoform X2 n=1 Tax=Mercurialis annua TaxID=3986 RepID=UPI00215FD08C|nr:two-component response regulator-like APRR2 isoform X2 [Mercurialis annua]
MVCTANELSAWTDFPKGLRVLVLEEDAISGEEIKSKLEAMDYIVSLFCNESEALSAVSDKAESFHVAIVEVSVSNSNGSFRFLETAKDLPIIMTSNIHCLSTMMKCIALGAVEFLRKPLSEDKLRNIWQHVVHKAFNAGGNAFSESLKPVKDSVASMVKLKVETEIPKNENSERIYNVSLADEIDYEQSPHSDKYPAPLTPQLKQGARLLDDGDCQEHTNFSTEKESGEQEGECKSVETTSATTDVTFQVDHPQSLSETIIKEEDDSVDGVKSVDNISDHPQNKGSSIKLDGKAENANKASGLHNSFGTRGSRKKIKKYRMHKRHILPKEDDRRWPQQRDQIQRNYYQHKPLMAYPPYHVNPAFPMSSVYPMWGATGSHPPGVQMWGSPGYPPWPPAESWHWKPYPGIHSHADAWGCPVMPPTNNPYHLSPQNAAGFYNAGVVDYSCSSPQNSFDHLAEEVIDKVVKEAINKPWLPLPLGLKPPSTDSVLDELSRQGISTVPPHINALTSL